MQMATRVLKIDPDNPYSYEFDAVREVVLDFNKPYVYKSRFVGYVGEHNATQLEVLPPREMAENEDVSYYCIKFLCGEKVIPSKIFPVGSALSLKLWNQLTQYNQLGVQLEAYDEQRGLVAKSKFIANLYLLESANKEEVVSDENNDSLECQIIESNKEIKKNTEARHIHENKSVLDNLNTVDGVLTYNGQSIKGNGEQGDWSQSDSSANSYIKNRTHYDIPGYSIEWDGEIGDKENVFIVHDDEEGDIYFVRVADNIPLHLISNISSDDIYSCIDGETTTLSVWYEPLPQAFESYDNGSVYLAASYVIYVTKDNYDISKIFEEEMTKPIVLGKGVWVFKSPSLFINKINIPDYVKQLDVKYIPDIAFGKIELEAHEGYSTIKVTDRNGKITSTDIRDGTIGKTPIKGMDYWTTSDKAEIVNETISALPKWNGGSY